MIVLGLLFRWTLKVQAFTFLNSYWLNQHTGRHLLVSSKLCEEVARLWMRCRFCNEQKTRRHEIAMNQVHSVS